MFLSLYSQICTAGLCFCCCSLGNRFRTLRWSWWTGPSQTSPFRTTRFCECLPWLPSFPAPPHQGRGLFWGRGEGGEGEADGPWASLWSCPVLMPFFTPRFPELSTDYCPPIPSHTAVLRQGLTLNCGWSCMGPVWKRREP